MSRFFHFPLRLLVSLGLLLLAGSAAGQAQPAGRAIGSPPAAALPPAGPATLTTSDGVRLYATIAGQGTPCVFIHGGPGAGSQVIENLAGAGLEQQFRMIYLDQRGSGRSASDPHRDYSLPRVLQDLEEVRQQLHLTRWVLMAHSFGGIIATAYAQKYPERVQGLILVNSILNLPAAMESTVAYGYPLLPAQGRPPLDAAAPLPQRYLMVMALLHQHRLLNQLMYDRDSTARQVQRALRQAPANHDMATVVTQSAAIADYVRDFTPASAALAMPVLVVTGQQDYVAGPDQYKAFRFPHQQVLVRPGRHNALLEDAPALQPALAAFATRVR